MSALYYSRLAVAISAVLAAPLVLAATTATPEPLYGGGAAVPNTAWVGSSFLAFNPAHRLSTTQPNDPSTVNLNPADSASLLGQYTAGKGHPWVSFCAAGTGPGKNVLIGTFPAQGSCGDFSQANPSVGFAVPAGKDIDFSASEIPLNKTEYNTFLTSSNRGPLHTAPVQFPALSSAIAVVYNNADLGTARLNLTQSQLCQVFSGQITDWNALVPSLPSKPIKIVYRTDNAGSGFAFTNHLSKVCGSAYPTAVTGWSANQSFALAVPTTPNLPSTAVGNGVNGNAGVVTKVQTTDGTLGYADVADAKARASLVPGSTLGYATLSLRPDVAAWTESVDVVDAKGKHKIKLVKHKAEIYKKFDPINDFPKAVAVTAVSDVVLGPNDSNGRPTLVAAPVPLSAVKGCFQTVNPDSYAEPAKKKGDYTQYPLFSVGNLLGFHTGNGTHTASVVDLFRLPYKVPSKVKTVGKGTGYATLSLKLDANAGAGTVTKAYDLPAKCVLQ